MDEAKRDITNLASIYGAIDRQLESEFGAEGAGNHPVALLLPVYQDPDAYWFESFVKHAEPVEDERWEVDPLGDPSDLARHALGMLSQSKPLCRNRARRLFAVGAAARTFPELEADLLAAAAFGKRDVKAFGGRDSQWELLAERLREPPQIEAADAALDLWWTRVLEAAPDGDGYGPRPCTARLTWVRVRDHDELVPTFQTEQDAAVSFDAAAHFLDPENWTCFPCWCKMELLGESNGVRKYQEVVSFDCVGHTTPVLTVNLDFKKRVDPRIDNGHLRVGTAEYRLSDDQPEQNVFVNQGYLEIRELSREYPMVRVSTSKTLKLSPDYGGPGLIFILCHLGYMSMLGDLFCCASRAPDEAGYPDIPYPGRRPPQAERRSTRAPGPGYGGLIKVMVDETADAVEECIDEFADAAKTAYRKVDEKSYKADDLVQDIADSWARMFGKGARVANASIRVARSALGAAVEPSSGGEDDPAIPGKAEFTSQPARPGEMEL